MWDFHSHILPSIDDGAKSLEEAVAMAEIAVKEGIHTMVVTPHFIVHELEFSKEELHNHLQKFKEELQRRHISLTLLPGTEAFADLALLEKVDQKSISTINNTRYLLLELPMMDIPIYIEDLLFELKLRDIMPIIAHPERNVKIQEDPSVLSPWIEQGILTQLNTGSLRGIFGKKVQETAETLLTHNMIHILGTDAHTSRRRSPKMKQAAQRVQDLLGPQKAQKILEQYPKQILDNEIITPAPPIEMKKKKRFLFF